MSPENESLSPYLIEMSPEKDRMSPDNNNDASTESVKSGDGDTGNISCKSIEDDDKTTDIKETIGSGTDQMVGFRAPFYYCKQHPNVQNIHREEIEHHTQYSKEHGYDEDEGD